MNERKKFRLVIHPGLMFDIMQVVKKIILASQSPRRQELLSQMGVEFEVFPSNFDEKLDESRPPEAVAIELAVGKASLVADKFPESIVIGSDLIVAINGMQLEKPHDANDAHRMLKLLSGHCSEVTTAAAVICKSDNTLLTAVDTTKVYFKPYSKEAIDAYIKTGDSLDKAGAYGIQSGAAPLIEYIEGQYDTVVGLPTQKLAELLRQVGVSSKAVELESPVRQVIP